MIKIICFNKVSSEFKQLNEFYIKKINKKQKIEIVELIEFSSNDYKKNQKVNCDLLNDKLLDVKNKKISIVILDVKSKQVDSIEFSKIIKNSIDFNDGNILFVIGPSGGYSSEFLEDKKCKISLGSITYPHQLARIILLEQIYRSLKIINNEIYHK